MLVPELDVADLDRSPAAYVEVLGFRCHASRPEERFACLIREGVHLMPPLEERWYRQDQTETGHRQFVVADPDGYLLRFFSSLATRPATAAGGEVGS